MSTLLASLTEKFDAPDVVEEPTETEPETDDTGEESTEETEESTEDTSAEEPAEEAEDMAGPDDGRAINPRKKYVVDGKEITGKELLDGRLMREDYTRKTQKLAEFRKELEGKLDTVSEERDDAVDWIKGLEDVDVMEAELERYFPETLEKLISRAIDQAIAEEDAGDHKEAYRKARKAELAERQRKLDEARAKVKDDRKQKAVKTAELRANFDKWTREAMAAAGLDYKSEKHRNVFSDRIMSAYGKEPWTQETFTKTAKYAAEVFGIKAPVKKAEVPKLPPVAKTGAVAPAKVKAEARRPPQAKKDTATGFAELRKRFGA